MTDQVIRESGHRYLVQGKKRIEVFNRRDVANELNVSDETVRIWMRDQETPAQRIPGYWDAAGMKQWRGWRKAHETRKHRTRSIVQQRLNSGDGLYNCTDIARLMGVSPPVIFNYPNPPAHAALSVKGHRLWDEAGKARWRERLSNRVSAHHFYSEADDAVVLDSRLTTIDKAMKLGRTTASIDARLRLLRSQKKGVRIGTP